LERQRQQQQQQQQQGKMDRTAVVPITFRIRSTIESDIPDISEVWAQCVDRNKNPLNQQQGPFNFRRKMEFLKSKDTIQKLLVSRLQTIRLGQQTIEECYLSYEEETLEESDRLRYLWSNERFRTCVERATQLSKDPHIWTEYNFACAPQSTKYLQHKMLTAEDRATGELLGFCEIAMLQNPMTEELVSPTGEKEEDHTMLSPTLMNVIVNPKFQRRGVASRMIRSAQTFVHKEWNSDRLSLYVNSDNIGAISLYRRHGFLTMTDTKHSSVSDKEQYYMSLQLGSGRRKRLLVSA